MKNVIELIRVSTAEQAQDDRASIPAQHAANLHTCQLHNLQIVESLQLVDVSGTAVLYAPEMARALQLMKRPDVVGVVAREHSRLMRPARPADYVLVQAMIENHVILYTPDGVCDFSTKQGRFFGMLRFEMGEMERRDFLEKTWGAKEQKRRRGDCPQSDIVLPFGVGVDRSTQPHRWYYKPEAEQVRAAFQRFLAGEHNYSVLSKICGVTPAGIRSILHNPIFTGIRHIDKMRDKSPTPVRGDRAKVQRTPDEVIHVRVIPESEALISARDFSRVQQIMEMKATRHWKRNHAVGVIFTYTGFLTCGACGQIVYTSFARDFYYICKGRRMEHSCSARYMQRDRLEQKLDDLFAQRLTDEGFLAEVLAELGHRSKRSGSAARVRRLQVHIAKLEQKRLRVVESYCEAIISKENRDVRLAQIAGELVTLQKLLMQEQGEQPELTAEQLSVVLQPFASWKFLERADKRALLSTVVPDIHVADYKVSGIALNPGLFDEGTDGGIFSGSNIESHSAAAFHIATRYRAEKKRPLIYLPLAA